MQHAAQRGYAVAGLVAASLATFILVRTWAGERALAVGDAARRRGEFAAAESACRTAIDRGNVEAAEALARFQLLRQEWDGAAQSARLAMGMAPARGMPHLLMARWEMERAGAWGADRTGAVESHCRRAAQLAPADARIAEDCASLTLAARERSAAVGTR